MQLNLLALQVLKVLECNESSRLGDGLISHRTAQLVWRFRQTATFRSGLVLRQRHRGERFDPQFSRPFTSASFQVIDNLLKESYNKHYIPAYPVRVRVDMWVQEVTAVSELTQDFEIGKLLTIFRQHIYIHVLPMISLIKFVCF